MVQVCRAASLLASFSLAALLANVLGAEARPIQVNTTTQHFVDSFGRTRIFHGVNAVYKIPPWLPVQEGFDTTTTLSPLDAHNLSQVFGFTAIRLGFMWPGAAPEAPPAPFDAGYTAKVRELVKYLGDEGIFSILDVHQDLYNRKLCGEGAPDWAACGLPAYTLPFPVPVALPFHDNASDHGYPPLEKCLQRNFGKYYFADAVGKSFQALYDNTVCAGQKFGLRDAFSQLWGYAATQFASDDNVLGYELINEPWAGDVIGHPTLLIDGNADKKNLYPMYQDLHKVIRSADDEHIIFFEHALTDVLGRSGFDAGPGGRAYNDRQALSYHIYCAPGNASGNPTNIVECDVEDEIPFAFTLNDIKRFGCGGMMTEFGAYGDTPVAEKNLDFLLGQADAHLQSWTYWQYKLFKDITTAGDTESFYDKNGELQTGKVRRLVRTYAQAIQGVPHSMNFNPSTKDFVLTFTANPDIKAPTVIFASEDFWYTKGFNVAAEPAGSVTISRPKRNFVEVTATQHAVVKITITAK